MASTTGSSLHNGADVEKTAGVNHAANGAHGQHGVTGVSTGSPAYASQEGGAPFNLRNITPGGHPLDRSQPAFPTYHRRFANPAPLGLCGFALTTFMLSLINGKSRRSERDPLGRVTSAFAVLRLVVAASTSDERVEQHTDSEDDALAVKTRGVTVPNVVVGPALFYGGLAQLLAGMWEFATGNTFGATAFSSYGAFWLAYAFIVSPWSAIASSYEAEGMFGNGVAFFLWGWFIFTFIMLLASLRSSIALTGVFFFLTITFLLLGIAELGVGNASAIQTAGGAFGLITAFNAWYVAAANLMTPDQSFFVLPVGDMSKKD
ncbi:GPR1/FUN34/yaaH family-domain containing protein [Rhodotorula toruloides]|uniref:GPR1/FUN34/yaaH family-domain containing protein n=1 Tax=Rhodotorula toruloides TaxID=5286 RepID=A0A2T0A9X5_RHOTO|nr:GPR1/FUN34/yaaH family-domain containing protein [Rhodotorula toruloides]